MGWFFLDQPDRGALVAHSKEAPRHARPELLFQVSATRILGDRRNADGLWPAAERAGVPVSLAAAMFLPTVRRIANLAAAKVRGVADVAFHNLDRIVGRLGKGSPNG
jgi:hypothetical protein